jgi:hypothetical protein
VQWKLFSQARAYVSAGQEDVNSIQTLSNPALIQWPHFALIITSAGLFFFSKKNVCSVSLFPIANTISMIIISSIIPYLPLCEWILLCPIFCDSSPSFISSTFQFTLPGRADLHILGYRVTLCCTFFISHQVMEAWSIKFSQSAFQWWVIPMKAPRLYFPVFFLNKLNSVALVRERTIPTERPPLVGEVSANLWG